MKDPQKKKNAIERFKERPFRHRVLLFFGLVAAWVLVLSLISGNKTGKETAYSLQAYWMTSAFFIFILFNLMFKRSNE